MQRIKPEQAHDDMESGALLICAYDDPQKCEQYNLEGSMSLDEFQNRESSIAKDQELIFYCN